MTSTRKLSRSNGSVEAEEYAVRLERATRGLLELNVSVLEQMETSVGLAPLRALQSLNRRGPSMVGELGDDLGLVPSTASRLSDRLAEAGLITRRPAPSNRRSTLLELTEAGHAILDELIALRIRLFGEVASQMSEQDRATLVQGAHAFTAAQHQLSDKTSKQRGESRRAGDKP
jgi:DNA-binding MarR family transcriptional regulator